MDLVEILRRPEGKTLEFKRELSAPDGALKTIVAFANTAGGVVVLGVTDKRPRQVVGTQAFSEPGRTEAGLFDQLRRHIPVEEYVHEGKRVLIVHVPARLPGTAWQHRGSFWMRVGDALLPMSDEQLRRIHQETGPDFSAEPCDGASV
jgi:ATP-dependent DNA helicase RecG